MENSTGLALINFAISCQSSHYSEKQNQQNTTHEVVGGGRGGEGERERETLSLIQGN